MTFQRQLALVLVLAFAGLPGVPALAGNAERGHKTFELFCSHCHGGNMVNPGTVSFDLRKFPHDNKPRFVTSLTAGKGNMPPFGGKLTPDEVEDLWTYVLTGGKL